MTPCPFCAPEVESLVDSPHALAFLDAYPVSAGHSLVCPRRHVGQVFDLREQEWAELWTAVRALQRVFAVRYAPNGWNVGVNCGVAAGQTVGHAHVHVIPRYAGDVGDPRGGVRAVVPERADYWTRR